ncbi:hypothetical protein V6246_02565 [Algibacter sp. TI.3.09]|uniref:hypothetical protein n=1 Tax=Algibacter sp. TI.3.09 TaxID=3121298 RepID=UPI00311F471E
MNAIKKHIIFKALTVLLALMLFVPAGVKMAHVFAHHHHKVCTDGGKLHIHQVDLDCEFHKFHINNNFSLPDYTFTLFTEKETPTELVSQYRFISEFQQLQASLRGPPVLI